MSLPLEICFPVTLIIVVKMTHCQLLTKLLKIGIFCFLPFGALSLYVRRLSIFLERALEEALRLLEEGEGLS